MRWLVLALTGVVALIALRCGSLAAPEAVQGDDGRLATIGGVVTLAGAPFTGTVEKREAGILTERTPYLNGRIHGDQELWFKNGKKSRLRPYVHGKQVGAHRGWYETGEPRHLYEFADGQFHGESWEWTPAGQIYRYARYEHGVEVGAKIWRADGKIYANYVLTKERIQGLPGGHLCRIVEEGEDGETAEIR